MPVPAYKAMQEGEGLGARMLDILLRGVSTRQYGRVLPEMADTVGVSRSSVSRETIEAAEAELDRLLNRRFDEVELLILYIDGMVFGDHYVIAAVGVDAKGRKHVLGIQQGATENAAAVQDLLEELVRQGVSPEKKRLFVIDGSKALRAAMRAAWRLDHKAGMAKLQKLAEWLEREYPAAAASLVEGLEECFTINRLGLPVSLHRCLATTNVIESPQAGVRLRTRRVCRWRDAEMVKRWVAASLLATEKNFRRLMGYQDLWMSQAILEGSKSVAQREVA